MSVEELVLFWKLANGTRCVVVQHGTGWQLRVVRHNDVLVAENYDEGATVIARAQALRLQYDDAVA